MNWTTIIVAAIASVPSTLIGVAVLLQSIKTHKAVNSRLTQLLELTQVSAKASGVLEEKNRQKDKQ